MVSLGASRRYVLAHFRDVHDTNATKDRGNDRERERERGLKTETERKGETKRERRAEERVHAGSHVYTRITQTVVGELTYCNYRGNYCRHISRIRCSLIALFHCARIFVSPPPDEAGRLANSLDKQIKVTERRVERKPRTWDETTLSTGR